MRRIYRSKRDRVIAGICGGVADMFKIDPTLVRLLVVLAALVTAVVPFVITYLIGWIIIPNEDEVEHINN